jgi:hypothetical protein
LSSFISLISKRLLIDNLFFTNICIPGAIFPSIAFCATVSILAKTDGFIPTFSAAVNPKTFNFSVESPELAMKFSVTVTGNFLLTTIAPKINSAETSCAIGPF